MANKKIVDLNPIVTPVSTDLMEWSQAPHSASSDSVKQTRAQLYTDIAQNITTPPNQRRYVAQDGVDDPTSGTQAKPYATIAYAVSQITDASISKLYELVCTGNFNFSNWNIYPNIIYDITGASITTNQVVMNSAWAAATNGIGKLIGGRIDASTVVDLSYPGFNGNKFVVSGVDFVNTPSIVANGTDGTAGAEYVTFINCISSGTGAPLSISNQNHSIIQCNFTGYQIGSTSNSNKYTSIFLNNRNNSASAILYASGSQALSVYMYNTLFLGSLTINGTPVSLSIDVNSYYNAISFAGGATDSQVSRLSNSDGLIVTYNPTNYTKTSNTVNGHFQGINNALGSLGFQFSSINFNSPGAITTLTTFTRVTCTSSGFTITLPDPSTLTIGQPYLISSAFSRPFNLADNLNNYMYSMSAAELVIVYTTNGTSYDYVAPASKFEFVNDVSGGPVTIDKVNNGQIYQVNTGSPVGLTINASAVNMGFGWRVNIVNIGTTTATLDAGGLSTFNGNSTFDVPAGYSAQVVSQGISNYLVELKLGTGLIALSQIANGLITLAKIENLGALSVIGNPSDSGPATPQNVSGSTLGQVLTVVDAGMGARALAFSILSADVFNAMADGIIPTSKISTSGTTFTTTWSGPYASPVNANPILTSVGGAVTMGLPSIGDTVTTPAIITSDSALPVNLRPLNDKRFICVGDSGSVNVFVVITVKSSGIITISNGISEGNFTPIGTGGVFCTSVTWDLFV